GLMTEEKSVNIIRQIIKAYDELYKEKKDIVSVKAHVAKELNAEEVDALQQNLQKAINKKADMTVEVDEKLLGGIMLRIENTFLDATLQSNLNRLQGELLQS
ncbi:MAG TPA: ATP synthase F1 subunit delta, partial [Candidatus Marinimicrobia bacterium]|nr:ATP synthase F1 subunit delta [Candidatus Neomarinimicrobiota bacterium]